MAAPDLPIWAGRALPRRRLEGLEAFVIFESLPAVTTRGYEKFDQSNFTAIGSGVHVGEWGINLHNRGASFSLDAAHCNVLAPGKMPMHTLIPTMVMRDGTPAYVFGTMGGHVQAQIHLQVLTRMLHDGDDPLRAVSAPRLAVEPSTGEVGMEARFDASWVDDLVARRHAVRAMRAFDDGAGHAHAIQRLAHGWAIGSDPRAESATAGT